MSIENTARLETLLAAMGRGERDAMGELYTLTADTLYGYALSLLKNSHDAEDVLHDAYVSVWQAAGSYQPQRKPLAWLFTIVRNLAMSVHRRQSRQGALLQEPELPHRADPEERLLLAASLSELADDEREILYLHAVAGLKHREIAGLMHKPLPTVLSRYHRALKKMQTILGEEDG